MKKNKEWLRNEVNELPLRFLGFSMLKQREEFTVSKDDVLELIDQLDEPETLSEYWIEQKSIDTHVDTLNGEVQVTFRLDDLQNLLVPKQEREQKYYVDLDTAAYVAKWDGDGSVQIYTDSVSGSDEYELHLTEQEIKDYDERYWPFAVKVEELEE